MLISEAPHELTWQCNGPCPQNASRRRFVIQRRYMAKNKNLPAEEVHNEYEPADQVLTISEEPAITLHAPHGHPDPPQPIKVKRGEGTSISIDFSEEPELLADIRRAAKGGKNSPPTDASKWLRWRILTLHAEGKLFPEV
jgi:hypothetical protein